MLSGWDPAVRCHGDGAPKAWHPKRKHATRPRNRNCGPVKCNGWFAVHLVIRKNIRPGLPSGNRALQAVFASTCAIAKVAPGFCVTQHALLFQETEKPPSEASPITKRATRLSFAIEANAVL